MFSQAQPFKIKSASNATGTGVRGIDFSPLDVNLWHMTDTRGTDAGHGREVTFDNSRPTRQDGTNSLYFGLKSLRTTWQPVKLEIGIRSIVSSTADITCQAGPMGAIESVPVDLTGYSADDLPTLYFTYYLDTGESQR